MREICLASADGLIIKDWYQGSLTHIQMSFIRKRRWLVPAAPSLMQKIPA